MADPSPEALTTPTPAVGPDATAASEPLSPNQLRALGILNPTEVDRVLDAEASGKFLIEGLLPTKSITILAGDSGIGKSPLVLKLALAVAAGVPFLGMPTTASRVLYLELENSLADHRTIRDALARFLNIASLPEDLLVMPEPGDLRVLVPHVQPHLVVIDSLRAFRPDVTESNSQAGAWLKEIRTLARKHDCAFVIVHHLRKPGENQPIYDLESCRVTNWLLAMEGPRALVNQTDIRIAIEEGNFRPAALRLKWSRRVYGDSPLMLLERCFDDAGEPSGYNPLTGVDFLSRERREAFVKLPAEFSFAEAKNALARADDPTNKFLNACRQLGLVKKLAKGRYRKIHT